VFSSINQAKTVPFILAASCFVIHRLDLWSAVILKRSVTM